MKPERWQHVNDIFHAALTHEPARRPAFLDESCADDPTLREEVASLLTAHEAAGSFLDSPAFDADADLLGDQAAPSLQPLDGRQLGPYLIHREIGRGGMGVVHLAEDTRLGRQVAIKMLPPALALDTSRRERLMQEARAAAALSHPGIATIHALEEIEGLLFIVAEYVRGSSLRDELLRGPLPASLLVDTAVEIAQALAAAHAGGVVHRDLKPENVLRGDDGRVKILDFGLARLVSAADAPARRLTAAGLVLGTPAYMAPEQFDGRDVDFRGDIYSFGAMTYELATGTLPDLATPAPLPLPELDRIVRRCLRRQPEQRYASTQDLVGDLERLRDRLRDGRNATPQGSLAAGDESLDSQQVSRRWWRMHQLWVSLAYLAMLYPAWLVKEWRPGWGTLAAFLALVAASVTGSTLRWHLLFTERFNIAGLASLMRRSARWIRAVDYSFSALLLLIAAAVVSIKPTMAALLVAVATALGLASVVIEPATTRAAFRRRPG